MVGDGLLRSRPLLAAILFQAALIPLALVLAALAGLDPRRALQATPGIVLGGVLATVPLVAALLLLGRLRPGWFEDVERLVRPLIGMLFRGRRAGPVLLVAALAGLGEELLFRGVLQVWLAEGLGGPAGLLLASVIFGMAHALSRAYFLLATAMGLYLGGLFAVTGSLLLPVIVHAVYDAVAIALLLRPPQGGREAASDRVP